MRLFVIFNVAKEFWRADFYVQFLARDAAGSRNGAIAIYNGAAGDMPHAAEWFYGAEDERNAARAFYDNINGKAWNLGIDFFEYSIGKWFF